MPKEKITIYQIFTRLFGNTKEEMTFDGNRKENGCENLLTSTQKYFQKLKTLE
ncbi:MAG: hypothetical protein U5L09_12455 [Bacteroidales bacterium]|nr:hypothetical protein [Bacteroidales bacterium]